MILFFTMNRQAFSLIELLIVVTIVAILVGVALPYYQDYVKETRMTKAKHELDVLKQALIKYDTFENKKFQSDDLRILLGNYLQDLPRDPWGRDYKVDYIKGQVMSLGPDSANARDDVIVDYKPPLALQKATWVDVDNNRQISGGDFLRLEFSRYVVEDAALLTYDIASPPTGDLLFSPDVAVTTLIATSTPASTTEILIEFNGTASDTALFPGSSTVRIAPSNSKIKDHSGRFANGTNGEYPGDSVIIKAN